MNNRNILTALLALVLIAFSATFIVDEGKWLLNSDSVKLYHPTMSQVYIL